MNTLDKISYKNSKREETINIYALILKGTITSITIKYLF